MRRWNEKLKTIGVLAMVLAVGAFGMLQPGLAEAATAGPNNPTAASGWTNPTNALTANTIYATFTGTSQTYLTLGTYGLAIPAGSTINGIQVSLTGLSSGSNAANRTVQVALTTNGSAVAGLAKTQVLTTSNATYSLGSTSDLWGATLTDALVNGATFGVLVRDNDTTSNGTFSVDVATVTVTYTLPYQITSCTGCHNSPPVDATDGADAGSVPDRDNPPGVGAVIGSHGKHTSANCSDCHTNVPAGNEYGHSDGYIDVVAQYAGYEPTRVSNSRITQRSNMLTYTEAQYTAETWFGSCSSTACHTTTASPDWGTVSAAGCALCHGNPPTTNAHTEHMNTTMMTAFNCSTCHTVPATAWDAGHMNGTAGVVAANGFNGTNCTTASCHEPSPAMGGSTPEPAWSATGADCGWCHSAAPTTGDHTLHLGRAVGAATCDNCHATTAASNSSIVASSATHINGSRYNVSGSTGVTISYTQGTPSTCTATCHSVPAEVRNWATVESCDGCHGNPPASGAHAVHNLAPIAQSDCDTCHTGASAYIFTPSGNHQNGSANVAAGYTGGTDGTCASACHNSSVGDGSWTDTALNCDACHGNAPASGKHTSHMAASAVSCGSCHAVPVAGDTAHITDRSGASDLAVLTGMTDAVADEVSIVTTTLNNTNNTCSNTQCHNPSGGSFIADWDTSTSSCSLCHGDTATPPATGEHAIHVSAPLAVAGGCSACHPAAAANNHMNTTIENTAGYVSSTCNSVTGCHNNVGGATWSGSVNPACTDCHAATYVAASNGPTTGLHNMTQAGVQKHDATITGGCTACHDSTIPASHRNGTWVADSSSNTDRFVNRTNMTFTDAAANAGTCSGTGLTGCHTDSGSWSRLWSTAADSTATTVGDARCNVCHGQANNWRSGVSVNHNLTNINNGTHGVCETCHVIGALPYDFATHHEDSAIEYNSNAGYNTTAGSCANACHTNDAPHTLGVSTVVTTTTGLGGTSASCTTCHAYPPDPADGKGATLNYTPSIEGKGAHVKHATNIVTREGVAALNASTDVFGDAKTTAVCGACHNMADTHGNGTRAIVVNNNYRNAPTGGTNPTYDGTVGVGSASDPKTCSTTACHFVQSPLWSQP